jgi:hypothetical protein
MHPIVIGWPSSANGGGGQYQSVGNPTMEWPTGLEQTTTRTTVTLILSSAGKS